MVPAPAVVAGIISLALLTTCTSIFVFGKLFSAYTARRKARQNCAIAHEENIELGEALRFGTIKNALDQPLRHLFESTCLLYVFTLRSLAIASEKHDQMLKKGETVPSMSSGEKGPEGEDVFVVGDDEDMEDEENGVDSETTSLAGEKVMEIGEKGRVSEETFVVGDEGMEFEEISLDD